MQYQTKYFKVTAKCGHSGKKYFYKGTFFVKAQDGKAAAKLIRNAPRVKHNHKDAILDVCQVDYAEYCDGCRQMKNNAYFSCQNSTEQRFIYDFIKNEVYIDEHNVEIEKKDNSGHKSKMKALSKMERKYRKHRLFDERKLFGV